MSPDGKLIASCGRFGAIHLFTATSKEWVTTLKMNGRANALTFSSDGRKMYSFGGNCINIISYHSFIFPSIMCKCKYNYLWFKKSNNKWLKKIVFLLFN